MQQTIRMMNLQVGRYTFRTQTAFIHRKIVARLETYDVVVFDQEIHAALHRAVRTVCRHHFVYYAIRAPAAVWRIMQVRSEGFDDPFEIFDFAHKELATDERGQHRSENNSCLLHRPVRGEMFIDGNADVVYEPRRGEITLHSYGALTSDDLLSYKHFAPSGATLSIP